MKTHILKVFVGALLLTLQFGCGKKDNKNTQGTNYNQYQNQYGQTGQYVPGPNGQCMDSHTGQPAPQQACQQYNGGYMGGGNGMVQQCYGYYTYPPTGQTGICQPDQYTGRNNCSGYQMMDQNGQMVMCQ